MAKKTKKPEEPLAAIEPVRILERPLDKDDIRAEVEDIESAARKVNIDHNTPGIKRITKVIEYDYAKKSVVKAEFYIEV